MDVNLLIAPAPGLIVRDPITLAPLGGDGERKPASPYWLRRLADGDVVQLDAGPVIATVSFRTGRVLEDAEPAASNPTETTTKGTR